MSRPTQEEVARWIVQRNDSNPLVRDLAASLLANYIVQLEASVDVLERELKRRPARHLALCAVPWGE